MSTLIRGSNRRGWNRRGPTAQELFKMSERLEYDKMMHAKAQLLKLMGDEAYGKWYETVLEPILQNPRVSNNYIHKLICQEMSLWECDCTARDEIACPACRARAGEGEMVY